MHRLLQGINVLLDRGLMASAPMAVSDNVNTVACALFTSFRLKRPILYHISSAANHGQGPTCRHMVLPQAITLRLEACCGQLAFGPISGDWRHLLPTWCHGLSHELIDNPHAFVDLLGNSHTALRMHEVEDELLGVFDARMACIRDVLPCILTLLRAGDNEVKLDVQWVFHAVLQPRSLKSWCGRW